MLGCAMLLVVPMPDRRFGWIWWLPCHHVFVVDYGLSLVNIFSKLAADTCTHTPEKIHANPDIHRATTMYPEK